MPFFIYRNASVSVFIYKYSTVRFTKMPRGFVEIYHDFKMFHSTFRSCEIEEKRTFECLSKYLNFLFHSETKYVFFNTDQYTEMPPFCSKMCLSFTGMPLSLPVLVQYRVRFTNMPRGIVEIYHDFRMFLFTFGSCQIEERVFPRMSKEV